MNSSLFFRYFLEPLVEKEDNNELTWKQQAAEVKKQRAEAAAYERKAQEEAKRKADAEARMTSSSKAKKEQNSLFGWPSDNPSTGHKKGGIPTLVSWKQNHDGCIFGYVKGSSSFDDGQALLTSPIRGEVVGGTVIETVTGSK